MAPGGEVFSRLIHALGVVHIDAVNADDGSQDVIFVKISLHRFELFGSKSLHLDDNTSS